MSEFDEFIPIRLAANSIMAISFLLMMMDDNGGRRKLFFYCYFFGCIVMYFYGIFQAYAGTQELKPWNQACDDLNKKGQLSNINAKDLDECHETIKNIIHSFLCLAFIILALIQMHFIAVVYTHWKNFEQESTE